jgi:protein-S-isoprenylcysteine O-methyltransferase Ste14
VTTLKAILLLLFLPGTLLVLLPWTLIRAQAPLFSFGAFHWLAVPCWILGAASSLWCVWAFCVRGHGTPSPTDPPRVLVVSGLYRWIRNPIYAGVVVFLLGYVLWHPAPAILLLPPIAAFSAHLFVLMYEEPRLRKTFGAAYAEYCRAVPRWLPTRRPH